MFTTLAMIRADRPHPRRYRHLCKSLGGLKAYGKDTPLPYSRVLDICGFDNCMWLLEAVDYKTEWILKLATFGFMERLLYCFPHPLVQEYIRTMHLFIYGEETKEALKYAFDRTVSVVSEKSGVGEGALYASYNNKAWDTSFAIIQTTYSLSLDDFDSKNGESIVINSPSGQKSFLLHELEKLHNETPSSSALKECVENSKNAQKEADILKVIQLWEEFELRIEKEGSHLYDIKLLNALSSADNHLKTAYGINTMWFMDGDEEYSEHHIKETKRHASILKALLIQAENEDEEMVFGMCPGSLLPPDADPGGERGL